MHPGNILVRRKQITPSQIQLFKSRPHVVFLDVGMTTELSKGEQQHLLDFFKAVAVLDGHTAAACTLKLSKQQNCPNPNSFIEVRPLKCCFKICFIFYCQLTCLFLHLLLNIIPVWEGKFVPKCKTTF